MTDGPQRRRDDPQSEVDAAALEKWWANLPALAARVETNRQDAETAFKRADKAARKATRLAKVVTFIAVFALIAWLTVSWRQEVQQDRLDEQARVDRAQNAKVCEDLTDNARKFNALVDTLILRTQQSKTIPPDQKAQALELYTNAKQTLPVCTPPEEP